MSVTSVPEDKDVVVGLGSNPKAIELVDKDNRMSVLKS